jgi:hypothetical protein
MNEGDANPFEATRQGAPRLVEGGQDESVVELKDGCIVRLVGGSSRPCGSP